MSVLPSKNEGFTLIELSIVLVIIGLVTGGILVGQDLIRAAEVRATVTQIEKYNAAANTFKGKYGYLPGDIPDTVASSFSLIPRGTFPGQGDGNGIVDGNMGNAPNEYGNWAQNTGEAAVFWVDLRDCFKIQKHLGYIGFRWCVH